MDSEKEGKRKKEGKKERDVGQASQTTWTFMMVCDKGESLDPRLSGSKMTIGSKILESQMSVLGPWEGEGYSKPPNSYYPKRLLRRRRRRSWEEEVVYDPQRRRKERRACTP